MSAPVPADRRAFLGSSLALASAVAASAVPAVAEPHADAELLALRTPFDATLAALQRVTDLISPQEEAQFARQRGESPPDPKADRRLVATERLWDRRCAANRTVVDQIAAIPARTLEGVALKALASKHEAHLHHKLVASVMRDLLAMGGLADVS